MKVYAIAILLAATSISSVSSAMCMKKFLSSVGMNQTSNTNFYTEVKRKASGSSATSTTSVNSDSTHSQH